MAPERAEAAEVGQNSLGDAAENQEEPGVGWKTAQIKYQKFTQTPQKAHFSKQTYYC